MLAPHVEDPSGRSKRSRQLNLGISVGVLSLAVAVRLLLVARSGGGFSGNVGYDQGVYFAAADALTHGRLPYDDFVLLHPPGLMLVLTPFALLARLTGDHPAFVTANVAFSCLGALNAVLITRIALRWHLGRRSALAGGAFYAVWLSAAGPELGARLEPLGTFAFLCGVLVLSRGQRPHSRAALLAGLAFGVAATVKIWWIVPLLVLLLWYRLPRHDRRTSGLLLAGATTAVVVVAGPFFLLAPTAMWRMVVTDQLGRNSSHSSKLGRLFEISSLGQLGSAHWAKVATAALVVLVGCVLVAAAWRQRVARPFVVVAIVQLLVLLASPSFFGYYSGYFAPGAALLVAAAAGPAGRSSGRKIRHVSHLVVVTVVAVAAAVSGSALASTASIAVPTPLTVGAVPERIEGVRCVVADTPMALIALNALSRGLAVNCPNWVDVTGRTYDVDANRGRHVARQFNAVWQRDLGSYLLSGQAVVVIRKATGLGSALRGKIGSLPVLARGGRVVVRSVPGAEP